MDLTGSQVKSTQNVMVMSLPSLSHEECYPGFDCRYPLYHLIQNVHNLNLN